MHCKFKDYVFSYYSYYILRTFSVESVATKDLTKPRPLALNTVELMRAASSGLGIGPQTAMGIAERLYTQGYISYPRTETTSYPTNFDLMYVPIATHKMHNY